MTDANDTMRIWSAVEKTDPKHTKKVNQRGGFTAIDAHYQIMLATKQFGPVGIGWGYDAADPIFHDKFVIVPVTLWYGARSNTYGPVYGCAEMLGNRPDADAPKKAGTDALTKLLSHLGFNADVFLGKFDDNKYVSEVSREHRQSEGGAPQGNDGMRTLADNMIAALKGAPHYSAWEAITNDPKFFADLKRLEENAPPMAGEVKKAKGDAKERIDPAGQAA